MKKSEVIFEDKKGNVFIFWNTSRHNPTRNLTFVFLGKKRDELFCQNSESFVSHGDSLNECLF